MFRRVEGSGTKRMSSGGSGTKRMSSGGSGTKRMSSGGSGTKRMSSGREWHQEDVEWGGVAPTGHQMEGSGTKRSSVSLSGGMFR